MKSETMEPKADATEMGHSRILSRDEWLVARKEKFMDRRRFLQVSIGAVAISALSGCARRREWLDADGTASHRELMAGRANLEEYTINAPGGTYRAMALRSYDPKTKRWAIWWIDVHDPLGALDPPVKGDFDNGVGTFFSDGTITGNPARTRFVWSHITPTSARWEQDYSFDAGKTWETNWSITFARAK